MPMVNGKEYPYTAKGMAMAKAAEKKKKKTTKKAAKKKVVRRGLFGAK
jgi:hypothetical protein